jgi:hypothetical protein
VLIVCGVLALAGVALAVLVGPAELLATTLVPLLCGGYLAMYLRRGIPARLDYDSQSILRETGVVTRLEMAGIILGRGVRVRRRPGGRGTDFREDVWTISILLSQPAPGRPPMEPSERLDEGQIISSDASKRHAAQLATRLADVCGVPLFEQS